MDDSDTITFNVRPERDTSDTNLHQVYEDNDIQSVHIEPQYEAGDGVNDGDAHKLVADIEKS